ncbi:hypothetical protein ACH5RR_012163 [Cinchona calisaya]|uniref:Serine hydrolase domain-containing protein n=1 Tax=Cinchona calisaya TaxID=153742 RepID=A0ABD3AAK6_9GENT
MLNNQFKKKPRILCLHGHASSGKIFKEDMKNWPEIVLEKMDLVFLDAPFPTENSSLIGRFDPPYYEWFQDNEDHTVYKNFDQAVAYIEDHMIKWGPFDGVLGVSQGSTMTAALPGMQREGVAFTRVPKVKFLILISAYKLGGKTFSAPELAKNAFSSPIDIRSLHIIGEKDPTKCCNFELLESFVNPTVLYHRGGHGVPNGLDENGVKIVLGFLNKIQTVLSEKENMSCETSSPCCHYFDLVRSLFSRKRWTSMKNARIENVA